MPKPDQIKIAMVCGNKYAFRSIYVPLIRQLGDGSSIRLYLADYPEDYNIDPLLKDLHDSGPVEETYMIPDGRHTFQHHLTLAREGKKLAGRPLDLLIVDADFTPMHQYLISAARAAGAKVVAIQKEPPTQLLALYARATSREPLEKREPTTVRPITAAFQRLIVGPHRPQTLTQLFQEAITRALTGWRHAWRGWRTILNYRILPLVLIRQTFSRHPYEKNGTILFASSRVDAAVVYDEKIRRALRYFFPSMQVCTARHPLSAFCRCRPASDTVRNNLLILLAGPWNYYITPGNSGQDILQRWEELILQALRVHPCDEVHIRPHPRETDSYPERLAERLKAQGMTCRLLNPQNESVADLICDYAGVLGAASGALTEAEQACTRSFVIGVEHIQGKHAWEASAQDYSADIACVKAGEPLSREHFIRKRRDPKNGIKDVGEVIRDELLKQDNAFRLIQPQITSQVIG